MSDEQIVHTPATLDEAYSVLAARQVNAKVLAGGTDLMVLVNAHQIDPGELIDIWNLADLRKIEDEGATLRIGALVTWSQVIRSQVVRTWAPALVDAARTIGAVQIQNRGTIGGNVVNASPAGDSLPVLAAFDAEVELGSVRGIRSVAFKDFYTGYRRTVMESDELVVAIRQPKMQPGERSFFYKVGTRRAQAISKVVMAARLRVVDGVIAAISIGLGSVAPTVIRATQTEALLTGKRLNRELEVEAYQTISQEIAAITDLRSTEHYRRTVTGNLLLKLLREGMMPTSPRQRSSD